MCIIDRSVPKVFDSNSLEGIMEGCSAATWGGPATGIQKIPFVYPAANSEAPVYHLNGQRITRQTKGIIICQGKKYVNK